MDLDKKLEEQIDIWFADAVFSEKSLEQISKMSSSELKRLESKKEGLKQLMLSGAHRIGMEAIGKDLNMKGYSSSGGKGYAIQFANETKSHQHQKLSELTGVSDE